MTAGGAVVVRYFAGARDAAGTEEETVLLDGRPDADGPAVPAGPAAAAATVGSVGALRALLVARHPGLGDVLPRCSLLVGGVRSSDDAAPLPAGATVDVLPPFAGG